MKILISASNFTPDPIGVGKFSGEMAEWLASRGHEVRAVVAAPYYPCWKIAEGYSGTRYRREKIRGVDVLRCPIYVPSTPSGTKRLLQQAVGAFFSAPPLLAQALTWRPDVVWTVTPSFAGMPGALMAAWFARCPSWLHVQDFEVDAAFGLGLFKAPRLKEFFLALEKALMSGFGAVSTITPRMLAQLVAKRVTPPLYLFPNWVDCSLIFPLPGVSLLRREFGVSEDAFVALYSGNLGAKQGVDDLITVAKLLSPRRNFVLVIGGDGAGRAWLSSLAQGCSNIRFVPLQSAERFNMFLNVADVHLLPQKSEVADWVMPSKLPGMLASGRPVIASALPGTQLAQEVEGAGMAVPPSDPAAMVEAIVALMENPERRKLLGANAAERARRHWGKDHILERFEAELTAELARQAR